MKWNPYKMHAREEKSIDEVDLLNPGPNLLPASNDEALVVALNEVSVFAGPVAHLKLGVAGEDEALAGAVEAVAHA